MACPGLQNLILPQSLVIQHCVLMHRRPSFLKIDHVGVVGLCSINLASYSLLFSITGCRAISGPLCFGTCAFFPYLPRHGDSCGEKHLYRGRKLFIILWASPAADTALLTPAEKAHGAHKICSTEQFNGLQTSSRLMEEAGLLIWPCFWQSGARKLSHWITTSLNRATSPRRNPGTLQGKAGKTGSSKNPVPSSLAWVQSTGSPTEIVCPAVMQFSFKDWVSSLLHGDFCQTVYCCSWKIVFWVSQDASGPPCTVNCVGNPHWGRLTAVAQLWLLSHEIPKLIAYIATSLFLMNTGRFWLFAVVIVVSVGDYLLWCE